MDFLKNMKSGLLGMFMGGGGNEAPDPAMLQMLTPMLPGVVSIASQGLAQWLRTEEATSGKQLFVKIDVDRSNETFVHAAVYSINPEATTLEEAFGHYCAVDLYNDETVIAFVNKLLTEPQEAAPLQIPQNTGNNGE